MLMNGAWLGVASSVLAGLVAVGCGGNSRHDLSDDAGTGGMTASGGSGGSGQGGSGGSHPQSTGGSSGTGGPPTPAAVGFSISLSPPQQGTIDADIGSRACPAGASGARDYTLGKPAPGGTIADGTAGVSVACEVTAMGDVDAEVSGYDSATNERLAFNFAGKLDRSSGATSYAVLQFYSPQTLALHTGTPFPECTVGPITTLKSGAVLSDFSCPILIASDDTTSGCAVHGTLALEYCTTGQEAP